MEMIPKKISLSTHTLSLVYKIPTTSRQQIRVSLKYPAAAMILEEGPVSPPVPARLSPKNIRSLNCICIQNLIFDHSLCSRSRSAVLEIKRGIPPSCVCGRMDRHFTVGMPGIPMLPPYYNKKPPKMPPTDLTITAEFEKLSIPLKLLTAGTAACFADFASYPLDTAKVRLQIQGSDVVKAPVRAAAAATAGQSAGAGVGVALGNATTSVHYRGILGTIATITREEGFKCLYNGLNAGLQRQMCFASVRLGMYEPVKAFYQDLMKLDASQRGGFVDVSCRILAGLTTGGMAVSVAQPTDVVKIRFQAQMKSSTGTRYTGTWQAYKTIFATEGVAGLWRGVLPNIGRNAIVNVAEIVCYDIVKEAIVVNGLMKDNIPAHFTSAVVAGFCATLCASPVDVIKTRYMNSAPGKYRGAVDCAIQTFKLEGSSAFYKGFWPSFTRIVSWNIIMWITYEQLKRAVVTQFREKEEL